MKTSESETSNQAVLGQKYAYATVSLLLGIFCFINLAGIEKAVLAIVFGLLALRANPAPVLQERRLWAQSGLVLGASVLIIVPTLIIFNFDRLKEIVEVLSRMSSGR
jgi:hypothetical protein